jgi:hypothetical protein
LRVGTDYTRVRGFEIRNWINTDTPEPYSALRIVADYVEVDALLIHDEAGALRVKSDGITTAGGATGAVIRNSFLYDLGRAGIDDGWNQTESNPEPMVVRNCTLRRCTMFVDAGDRYGCVSFNRDKTTVLNTVAMIEGGEGQAFRGSFSEGTHHNAGDDGLVPGSPSFTADVSFFVGPQDLHLTPSPDSPLQSCGEVGEELDFDIDGETRPTDVWSIGADQTDVLSNNCDAD